MMNGLVIRVDERVAKAPSRGSVKVVTVSVPLHEVSVKNRILVKLEKASSPDTRFHVDLTVHRISVGKLDGALRKLAANKNTTLSPYCCWHMKQNVLSLTVESSGFTEEGAETPDSLCRLFALNKMIGTELQVFFAIFAPAGYLATSFRETTPSPEPVPSETEYPAVARRLILSSSSGSGSASALNKTISAAGSPGGGLIGILSSTPRQGHFLIADECKTDVVLKFYPLRFREAAFTTSGSIYSSLGFSLYIQFSPQGSRDEDEQMFIDGFSGRNTVEEVFNVSAIVNGTDGKGTFAAPTLDRAIEIHFDSTKHRPSAARQSRPFSGRLSATNAGGPLSARRGHATVAECKGLRCGEYVIDFSVTRSIVFPREEEVYMQLRDELMGNATESPSTLLSDETVEKYSELLVSRYGEVSSLSEEEVEDFQAVVWAAIRRCILDSAKLLSFHVDDPPVEPLVAAQRV